MPSYIKFYADGFNRDVIPADSPKIGPAENQPLKVGEIHRNPTTIALAKLLRTGRQYGLGSITMKETLGAGQP